MRILWASNAPWVGSGYGEQTALFLPRLRDQGHDVAALCNYGLSGSQTNWGGITCYPGDGVWCNTSIGTWADHHRADQIIFLCDAWVLNPDVWRDGLTAAVWVPLDHWPVPPQVLNVLKHERIQPIAMSKFGLELMERFDLDPIYVPHAVDTRVFRPQPEIKGEVRDELGIPRDVFLIGMVAANKGNPAVPRKGFPQAFWAFRELARRHDDVWMYVHTEAKPMPGGGGLELDILAEATQCPAGRLRFPFQEAFQLGIPVQAMAFMYQAFDVLLMPSMGEGFGIPLIEAQASGVPVVVSNHSAMPELLGAGWLVEGDPWWDELQKSWFIVPSIGATIEALEAAYQARDDQQLRDQAVEFAAGYDADTVADRYWRPALERLESGAENSAVEAVA